MKNKISRVIFLAVVLVISGCFVAPKPLDPVQEIAHLESKLDVQYPARGLADYPSSEIVDVPKGYAMVLLAEIDKARSSGAATVSEIGINAGQWLLQHDDENQNGIIGWGVPVAWDAYGDGSINPKNTEYTISTAIAVDALLSWLDFTDADQRAKILDVVEQSLEPYLDSSMRTPAGLLPYSLMPSDRRYDTFNPAAYLAGQMQRFSHLASASEKSAEMRAAADQTILVLLQNKMVNIATESWYWNYSIQENVPNDLPHAGYIIEGILTYMDYDGRLAGDLSRSAVMAHLSDFLTKNQKDVRAWPNFRPDVKTHPRLYDVSIGLQLSCRYPEMRSMKAALFNQLLNYKTQDGSYLKYPVTQQDNNFVVAEYEAYLLRALYACRANP